MLAVSTWALWHAFYRATDGYEDSLGFHPGVMAPPGATKSAPASAISTFTGMAPGSIPIFASVADMPTAAAAVTTTLKGADAAPSPLYPRHRRRSNSRAPFKVASAAPFEAPAPKRRQKRVDSTPPIAVSAQAVFQKILGQEVSEGNKAT